MGGKKMITIGQKGYQITIIYPYNMTFNDYPTFNIQKNGSNILYNSIKVNYLNTKYDIMCFYFVNNNFYFFIYIGGFSKTKVFFTDAAIGWFSIS